MTESYARGRLILASVVLIAFCASGVLFPRVGVAQEDGGGGITLTPRSDGHIDTRRARLDQRDRRPPSPLRRTTTGTSLSKAIGGIKEIGSAQSFALTSNSYPSLNFDVLGTPEYAGDVNGDGINDYVYTTADARDETTSALEDQTGKTALFYGGTPPNTPDQLLYHHLHPAGDLNNDGYADALRIDSTEVRIFEGSTSGYQDTGLTLTLPSGGNDQVRGFTDLDGDGFEDVLLSSSSPEFHILFGGSSFSGIVFRTYQRTTSRAPYFTYNVADIDQTVGGEIVRVEGRFEAGVDTLGVRVFNVLGDSTLERVQDFNAHELDQDATQQQLSIVDITGDGNSEIVSTLGVNNPTFAFKYFNGQYQTTPDSLDDDAIPVGDLDGDGAHDFYTFDDATETRYISLGISDLTNGLFYDTEITYPAGAFGRPEYDPRGTLGDLTGNGRSDMVLNFVNAGTKKVGRRFVSVDTDGVLTPESPVDVTYDRGNFLDQVQEVNEVGDLNDDGTDDFAIVRGMLGQVDVFFGGSSISSTPDLTITPPSDTLKPTNISSGDFDGNGTDDLLVGYRPLSGFGSYSPVMEIHSGGSGVDSTPEHTVLASTVGFPVEFPRAIGDVNGDGATDWMVSDRGMDTDGKQDVGIFFGGSTLPDVPDETLEYPDGQFLGEVKTGLGDVNGDGFDDFAFDNTVDRQFDVYFGGSSPSFSTPADLVIPVKPYGGITGGDFNGDGVSDIAAKPGFSVAPENSAIEIFYGGTNIDATADQRLLVPMDVDLVTSDWDTDGDGYANYGYGVLESAGDVDANGAEEIFLGSDPFVGKTNALLYQPSASNEPIRVFRGPNQDAALGSQQFLYSTAIGDFTGNGDTDIVGTQSNDNNDAYFSSRIYRFPIAISTPTASVSATSISETVAFGDSTTQSFQIDNTATSADAADLRYEMFVTSNTKSTSKRAAYAQKPRNPSAWENMFSSSTKTTTTSTVRTTSKPSTLPPLIVDDPVAADTASINLDRLHAGVSDGRINVVLQHAQNVDTTNYALFLAFDVDQDTSTGTARQGLNPQQTIGAEYEILDTNLGDGSVTLEKTQESIDAKQRKIEPTVLPVGVDSSAVHFAIPLSAIEGSPPKDVVGIVGTPDYESDWFPNTGNATIGPSWLTVSPASGSIPSDETELISVTFTGTGAEPGSYENQLRILTSDPAQDTIDVPVSLGIDPPPVSFTEPSTAPAPGSDISLDVSIPANFTPTSGTLHYRTAGSRTFRDTPLDVSALPPNTSGTVSATIPGSMLTETGVSYYVSLRGPLPDGTRNFELTVPSTAPNDAAFVPASLPSTTAAGPFQADTYRMITLPVALGDRSGLDILENQYGTYHPSRWRLARWNAQDSTYAQGEAVDSLRAGRAAWLITKGGDTLSVSNVQSSEAGGPVSIPLEPGWNQIGNPFAFPVAWADVQRPDAVRPPFAYTPTGYRSNVPVLSPWEGVFVYNNADSTVTVRVPPYDTSATASTARTAQGRPLAKGSETEDGYRLQATAKVYHNGDLWSDGSTWVGFSEQADKGFGPQDRAKPPGIGPRVRMHVRPDDGPALARSLKPLTEEGAAWDLEVGLHLGEPLSAPKEITIHFTEMETRPDGFKRYVIDRDGNRRLPITDGSVTVRVSKKQPTRHLRVIVGTESFARSKSDGAPLAIEQTKLRPNAPNPFTGSTTIHYQLAEKDRVTITVFDVLGRRIQTLVDRQQRAGVHKVEWAPNNRGRSLASGVYFCRMEAGSYTGTRKLVLVR